MHVLSERPSALHPSFSSSSWKRKLNIILLIGGHKQEGSVCKETFVHNTLLHLSVALCRGSSSKGSGWS